MVMITSNEGTGLSIMSAARRAFSAVLATALAATAFAAPAEDEQLLKTAKIGSDGPSLLAYFRQRTVTAADRQRIEAMIRQLGDPAYAVRERATADLIACGLPAIDPLRKARGDSDFEIARRAAHCLEQIERVPSAALSAAAARGVSRQKPAGAVAVLLAYLPVADDESVADEVRDSLAAVAVREGKPDEILVKCLGDPAPLARGAAAEALARSGLPAAVDLSRKSLSDTNADVRLRTAIALVTRAKDKNAVPAMIALLAELPQTAGWRIEDVLVRLAGDAAPKVTLGEDAPSRQKCRNAWQEWWTKSKDTIDLAKLDGAPPMLGYTLIVLRERNQTGRIVEVDANKKELWKIDGLQGPVDAVAVGRDRVLVVEQNAQQVSERDLTGKVIWSKPVNNPIAVHRLANGNTLVVGRNQIIEFDTHQTEVFSYQRQQFDICAAQKLRSGEVLFVTTSGQCVRLDAKGQKEVKTFQVGRMQTLAGLEVLPNDRFLMTQLNTVAEFDGTGGVPVWHADFSRPTSVQRLPNGNTLVASGMSANAGVAELDRSGKIVWEFKAADGSVPWRAHRR
jgi:PQQ-like domain/HEAT repeats